LRGAKESVRRRERGSKADNRYELAGKKFNENGFGCHLSRTAKR
jgi:hypothetical protein